MGFGEKLKKVRTSKHITQQELADHIGVTRATIAGYETKGKNPDYGKLIKIADYLEVTVRSLISEEMPVPRELSKKEYEDILKLLDDYYNGDNESYNRAFPVLIGRLMTALNIDVHWDEVSDHYVFF